MHSTITLRVTIRGIQKLRDVRAHIDDQDVSASVTIDGDHVVIPGERLTDGQHTVAMAAGTGNLYRRRLDRTWQFTVDTKPPSLTVETPAKETVFTMTPITISGTAEAAAAISVEDIEGSTVATSDGSYSLTVTPPDGKLNLTIQARDRAGNTSTIERRIVVDTTAPSLWVEAMGTVRTATPQLSVNVNDAACTPRLKVTVDGKPVYAKRKTGSRLVELGELAAHRRGDVAVAVERRRHLRQAQPELAQRHDPVQAAHVVGAVEPVSGIGPLRRDQQPDLVVVVQRPDRQAGPLGQLADAQLVVSVLHDDDRRPSRGVRCKPGREIPGPARPDRQAYSMGMTSSRDWTARSPRSPEDLRPSSKRPNLPPTDD